MSRCPSGAPASFLVFCVSLQSSLRVRLLTTHAHDHISSGAKPEQAIKGMVSFMQRYISHLNALLRTLDNKLLVTSATLVK